MAVNFLLDIGDSIEEGSLIPDFTFISSLTLQDIEKYKLGNPKSFHYLNQSSCYELDGVDDAQEYLATRRAMEIIGISQEEQVHLGFNADFFLLLL